jgi:hypothetical protein
MGLQERLSSRLRGMLLYLIKHSRSELANVLPELSKCIDGASSLHGDDQSDQICVGYNRYSFEVEAQLDDENWDLVV